MLQFNLLPDVKLQYVKTQRTKHLLTLVSFIVSAVGIGLLTLSIVTVDVAQKAILHKANNDIAKYSKQLKAVPDLNKILTVQNQLGTLTTLHDQKPVSTRLFTYIAQVTPTDASLNKLSLDYSAGTITLGGNATSLDVVSKYTDTLKATKYKLSGDDTLHKAFTNVVLSSFGRGDKGATFSITFNFDPAIFDSKNNVTLTVPSGTGADQSSIFGGGN